MFFSHRIACRSDRHVLYSPGRSTRDDDAVETRNPYQGSVVRGRREDTLQDLVVQMKDDTVKKNSEPVLIELRFAQIVKKKIESNTDSAQILLS